MLGGQTNGSSPNHILPRKSNCLTQARQMPSNYFSRLQSSFRQEIRRSLSGNESGIQDVLIGQANLTLHHLRLSHSLPPGTFTDIRVFGQPGTVATSQANLHATNRRKNISIIGAFSRVISIPSVSGPSLQVCGYHVDSLLSGPSSINCQKALMAVCGSKPALPDCSISMLTSRPAQHGLSANRPFSSYIKRSFGDFRKASMSLRNKEQPNNFFLYGYFIYNVASRKGNGYSIPGFGFESLHISSPACCSSGATPDQYFHSTIAEEPHSSSADSSESNVTVERTLKLNSASCYLPHPDKEETGGEDAHFICTDEQAIGVADGVGGWADVGIDAGYYARQLMSYSVNAIQQEPKGSIDPARVLEKAHASTKAKGSSTACIIALTDQGLHAVNLGDSGFMVVRDGCTVFRSPVQQHDFNFPYQLESGNSADLPSSGQVFNVAIAPGDVIIAGTDGLFDNLYNNDITAIVVHASRSGFGPQVTAQKIAALARQRALDKNRQTPFSSAAQEAGFRYYGGKLDDITVVVSYITTDHKEGLSAKSSN